MTPRFITSDGKINDKAIVAAVAASAKQCEWFKGRPQTGAELDDAVRHFRQEAKREQALHAGFSEEQWAAGLAFANGALSGLAGKVSMADYQTPANVTGSYERAVHWTAELAAKEARARIAAFGRCLDQIAARRDIVQYLQAAE